MSLMVSLAVSFVDSIFLLLSLSVFVKCPLYV